MPLQIKDFKLLAIRPRKNCDKRYCKNLQPDQLFPFFNTYSFSQQEDGMVTAIDNASNDFGLFDVFLGDTPRLKFNVSAVVGKNGSGKSTLVELFFQTCYLIAVKSGLISSSKRTKDHAKERLELKDMEESLKLEVYYQINKKYHCIVIDQNINLPSPNDTSLVYHDVLKDDEALSELAFFYTIALNYSIHGLNESTTGQWVSRLFHKNDGYQTPIVVNPFRDHGTIQVNGELHFAQTRLLTNLMLNAANRGELVPGKRVTGLRFLIDRNKLNRYEGYEMKEIIDELEQNNNTSVNEVFDRVFLAFVGKAANHQGLHYKRWHEYTIRYVLRKLIRIAKNYSEYNKYYTTYGVKGVPGIKDVKKYVDSLKKDHSHVTLKLRQAINFFRYDPLRPDHEGIRMEDNEIYIPSEVFVERLEGYCMENPDKDPAEFVAAAPFTPRIILEKEIPFHTLSSGEQQYIHTIQAIAYHLLNVNSVFNSNTPKKKITYNCINIILDEIELYFHPEFQRLFVQDLLEYLSRLPIANVRGINILFLTHSPFILSDIPSTNVLWLHDGQIANEEDSPLTFAGNIHQMLSSSFFMSSTTGDLAKYHYGKIISWYDKAKSAGDEYFEDYKREYSDHREKFKFIVSQIGEDVIRGVLKNHLNFLDQKYGFERSATEKVRDLEAQKAVIQQQINDLNATNKLS